MVHQKKSRKCYPVEKNCSQGYKVGYKVKNHGNFGLTRVYIRRIRSWNPYFKYDNNNNNNYYYYYYYLTIIIIIV